MVVAKTQKDQQQQQWIVRVPNLLAWRSIPSLARRTPKRTRRGIVGPSFRWTTFPAAWRVASMVEGAKRSFWWKRGFDNKLRSWSSVTDSCRAWTTHPLYWQPRRHEIVWEKAGSSIGGGWKHPHDVVQQKSQRSMTKMFLVLLLIVPVSAMWRRLALIGRRSDLEPTPLAGRSITPLARRMPKRTQRGIVGPSPIWTSVCRIIFWMRRTWLDRRSSSEGNRRTIAEMDQRKQDHLLEQQQNASKVTKTPGCEEGGTLSPRKTEDDCFASPRSLDRDAFRWRSLATRRRFRPKSRSSRLLANSL